ncbi:MAG: phosphoribosylaminoimidazolesuccinocarboxamide synthase [Deltaproteobacteria bacterium]|nr:phosphoribosylaminoimidazolesuccinocarboxamide synthase [Deltaproteobacteria bacterium]
MSLRAALEAQIPHTLENTELPGLGPVERGKVRDIYRRDDQLILVASDRLSAFDRVLTTVPFKGELLTRTATYWFEQTADIVPNHIVSIPDPSVMVVRRCEPIPVEIIVRGYITGSLWRDYQDGSAAAYGLDFPADLRRDQAFPEAILTPTTKAERGEHDLPISREEILSRGLVDEALYAEAESVALKLFARGVELAAKRGLILVDTKYEFGLLDGKVVLMDEIHTPDSSRYWVAEGYAERFEAGEAQQMLDKENIRQWLIQTHGYKGDGPIPEIPAEVRADLAQKYVTAYETLTGRSFDAKPGNVHARIEKNLAEAGLL